MSKNVCILSDWGGGQSLHNHLHPCNPTFPTRTVCNVVFFQYTVITLPNPNNEQRITVYDIL